MECIRNRPVMRENICNGSVDEGKDFQSRWEICKGAKMKEVYMHKSRKEGKHGQKEGHQC